MAGADATEVVELVCDLAKAFDLSGSSIVALFAKVERAFSTSLAPPPRAVDESSQSWVEAILGTIKSRKRDRDDAPLGGAE